MANNDSKPKDVKIGNAYIKAEISEDGRDVFIKIMLDKRIESFQQLTYLLNKFFAIADFKYIEKGKETTIQ